MRGDAAHCISNIASMTAVCCSEPRPAKSAFFSVAAAMRLRTASLFGMRIGV
jgi:hypothetical protein